MVAVLAGVIGLIVGAVAAWAYAAGRERHRDQDVAGLRSTLAVRDSELATLRESSDRERNDRDEYATRMNLEFENLSHRLLKETVAGFNETQEQVMKERASTLDRTLKPLTELLDEYKRNLSEFDKAHVGALGEVKSRAEELLIEQRRSQDETRRLSQLLGRSDHRGRWGEIQLANVLEASGLREHVDYDLQVSAISETGRAQRPDCVVQMPNGSRVAIDAKFPFDAFEAALSCEDTEERRTHELKHARDLRAHVKALRDKAYWESITPSPEFVACFVPSDVAVSTAFEADPELWTYANRERVLIVGPTNLISLLWSVAMVVRQQSLAQNAADILTMASTIYDRIRLVAEPVAKMGRALDTQVREYNAMISSFESRLIVSARGLEHLGVTPQSKELPELGPVEQLTRPLDAQKWGVDEGDGHRLETPPILDL